MKLVSSQLYFYFSDKAVRRNTRALLKYVLFLLLVIALFAVLFHYIMLYAEGERHSWITGLYWTLTVMSTLGFGDITFTSDVGRVFSIVVLVSGVFLLLIVLPFAFIRFFYAPWLEAQIHLRAPRKVPEDMQDHVIICTYDAIAEGLVQRFKEDDIPFFLLEPDPVRANKLKNDGISVIAGEPDLVETHRNLRVDRARMVIVNREDTTNSNIILTVRETAPDVPILALAQADEAVDVLQLCGATHTLPLKKWLGEQLANRITASHAHSHVIGRYEDLLIAELPIRNTPLAGKTVRETRLREISGVSIIGLWKRGRLQTARPDTILSDDVVPVISGTSEQLEVLDDLLMIYDVNTYPVLVIGGSTVGGAATRALRQKEIPVNVIDANPAVCNRVRAVANEVFEGNAADYNLLMKAGLREAPSVLLTTNDDAVNIYLTSYCRRLNPEMRIVSRVTHERNIESIHRAGADFVLSYASLGVAAIYSLLHGKELVVLGEGLDLFTIALPRSLHRKTLAQSGIGARTGLIVIGIRQNGSLITNPPAATPLAPGSDLIMLGAIDQRNQFQDVFG